MFLAKVLWKFNLERGPGLQGDVDMDRDLRGWEKYDKPEFSIRFLPVEPREVAQYKE